jgi:hypothetical protein
MTQKAMASFHVGGQLLKSTVFPKRGWYGVHPTATV